MPYIWSLEKPIYTWVKAGMSTCSAPALCSFLRCLILPWANNIPGRPAWPTSKSNSEACTQSTGSHWLHIPGLDRISHSSLG